MTAPVESDAAVQCGLCGHEMSTSRCGWAQIEDGTALCHMDDHDCYFAWTIRGERPYVCGACGSTDDLQILMGWNAKTEQMELIGHLCETCFSTPPKEWTTNA